MPPETVPVPAVRVILCPLSIVGDVGVGVAGVPVMAEFTPICKSIEFFVAGDESTTTPFHVMPPPVVTSLKVLVAGESESRRLPSVLKVNEFDSL